MGRRWLVGRCKGQGLGAAGAHTIGDDDDLGQLVDQHDGGQTEHAEQAPAVSTR